jgi:outer membrane murein-binding lipoprotein Lpp
MRTLRLIVVFAAVVATILLLGGCGGKAQDPKEALEQAASSAREAGSIHAQMNIALSPLGGEAGMALNVQGDARLDMNTKIMDAGFTVMGMELSLRYVDKKAYLQFGSKWYILSGDIAAGIGEGTIASVVNTLASYPDLLSSAVEVTELGEKTIGGYKCDNLQVTADPQVVASLDPVQQLAGDLDMTAEEIEAYLRDSDLQIEVCVQKDEPIIREVFLSLNTELPDIGKIAGMDLLPSQAHVEITIDIQEYGIPVEVQPPENASPFKGL